MHIQQKIRNHITGLISALPNFKRVTEDYHYAIKGDKMPTAWISTIESEIMQTTKDQRLRAPQKRGIVVKVLILVQANTDLQNKMDDLMELAEDAILQDPTLNGNAERIKLIGTSSDSTGEMNAPTGAVILDFIATVHTPRASSSTGLQQFK